MISKQFYEAESPAAESKVQGATRNLRMGHSGPEGVSSRGRSVMRCISILSLFWGICSLAQTSPSALIPVEHFTRPDAFIGPKISPDGRVVAFTIGQNGRSDLACLGLGGYKVEGRLSTGEGYEVEAFEWVSPRHLVFTTKRPRDFEAEPEAEPRSSAMMFTTDGRCEKTRLIYGNRTPPEETGSKLRGPELDRSTPRFLGRVKSDSDWVMITEHPWRSEPEGYYYNDPDAIPRIALVNVVTGKRRALGSVPLEGARLLLDIQGETRFAVGRMDSEMRMLWRVAPDAPWQPLDLPELVVETVQPQAFSVDGKRIFVTAVPRSASHAALYSLDPVEQKAELVHAFAGADVERVLRNISGGGEIVGLMSAGHKPVTYWLDPSHPAARLYQALQKAFPGQDTLVTSTTEDGALAIVQVSSEVDPGSYYLFDTRQLRAEFLRARSAWLNPDQMRAKQPLELAARDGLKLDGYVTVPPGKGPFPTVLLPHDGPSLQDTRAFDPIVQLLASRGYAVLQVNYRGSSGRGLQMSAASDGEWGMRMQDDLTDATRWAIDQRIADPNRICIFGSGYGGYAALMGVIREPRLYRCAVGLGGYYDLELLLEERDFSFDERQYFQRILGRDAKTLRARSPLHNATGIEAPVLLVHGEQDLTASIQHAQRMHSELRRLAKQVEFLAVRNESHDIYRSEARREVYQRILDFLSAQLGPGAPP